MKYKILFIYPDFNYVEEYMPDYSGSFSLGIGYLSAMLKKNKFNTDLIHLTKHITKSEFVSKINKSKPNLIAFSFFTHQKKDVIKYVEYIRSAGIKLPIILGGVHCTTNAEDSINIEGINYVCVGEGEQPLLDLCEKLSKNKSPNKIENIWIKTKKGIIRNRLRPLLQNLDELPFPDRAIFNYKNISDGKTGVLNVLTTRGCPYACTYCCNHIYQKIYKDKGKYVRSRTAENIIQEIKITLKKNPFLRYVNLVDDAFCLNKNLVKSFCEQFKKEIGLDFTGNTRVNLLNEEMIKTLSEGGCTHYSIGIESGNPKIRTQILKRFMSNKQIINVVRLSHKYNITVGTYNIIGLPTETIENVLETVKLNAFSRSDSVHVSIFQPYPNTELYDYCKTHKLISSDEVSTFFGEYKIKQKSISKREVNFAYKYFYIYLKLYKNFGNIKIFRKMLDRLFIAKKTHRIQLFVYPIAFFVTNPLLATYRLMLKISPKMTRNLKLLLFNRK